MLSLPHPRGLATLVHVQPRRLLVSDSQAAAARKKGSHFLVKLLPRFLGKRIATAEAFSDTQDMKRPFSHILDN
jgi:hypothetical protein